ncbi:MAG: disulfide bond formation protein B [Erythrobacter sp.]|uniref:disulfide bond formation protein B n=1 Tax=Erythrobacter sp. TaxID=1042 RepID=UPI002617801A|nr:disulfide bond formation protein B [Erythrobacter sp.]MDJ0978429.1 disulfide bond formation protein B [Erythrobacter sp.]
MTRHALARLLALALSGGLLAGAYVSELVFGLYPCEMCWWQRWPHFAALGLAALAFAAPLPRFWTGLSGLAILVSGLIGGFHAGVEYGWWEGITGCAVIDPNANVLDPGAAPLIRCDVAPWSLFGVSLAGFNFLFSCLGAIAILALTVGRQERARR